MKGEIPHKLYELVSLFSVDNRKARRILLSHVLSPMEKGIAKNFFLLRENKSQEVIALLSKQSHLENIYLQALCDLLLGMAYNNCEEFFAAEKHLEKARTFYAQSNLDYFHFVAVQNLFMVNYNLKNTAGMKEMLREMEGLPKNERGEIRTLLSFFYYFNYVEDFTSGDSIFAKIKKAKSKMLEAEVTAFLIAAIEYHVKKEDYQACYTLMDELKKFKVFHLTANFNFQKKILDHITQGSKIYVYKDDFENNPILNHQIHVLKYLEEGKLDQAKKHWATLKELQPDVYGDELSYLGKKCLFSICLGRVKSAVTMPKVLQVDSRLDLVDRLHQLFTKNESKAFSKEELIKFLWGIDRPEKDHYSKLSKTLYRFKKKYGVEIKSRKGLYILEKSA